MQVTLDISDDLPLERIKQIIFELEMRLKIPAIEYKVMQNNLLSGSTSNHLNKSEKNGILRFAKAGKKAYSSAAEADAFISQQRDQWQ